MNGGRYDFHDDEIAFTPAELPATTPEPDPPFNAFKPPWFLTLPDAVWQQITRNLEQDTNDLIEWGYCEASVTPDNVTSAVSLPSGTMPNNLYVRPQKDLPKPPSTVGWLLHECTTNPQAAAAGIEALVWQVMTRVAPDNMKLDQDLHDIRRLVAPEGRADRIASPVLTCDLDEMLPETLGRMILEMAYGIPSQIETLIARAEHTMWETHPEAERLIIRQACERPRCHMERQAFMFTVMSWASYGGQISTEQFEQERRAELDAAMIIEPGRITDRERTRRIELPE